MKYFLICVLFIGYLCIASSGSTAAASSGNGTSIEDSFKNVTHSEETVLDSIIQNDNETNVIQAGPKIKTKVKNIVNKVKNKVKDFGNKVKNKINDFGNKVNNKNGGGDSVYGRNRYRRPITSTNTGGSPLDKTVIIYIVVGVSVGSLLITALVYLYYTSRKPKYIRGEEYMPKE